MLAASEARSATKVLLGRPFEALVHVAEEGPEAGGPLVRWLWRRRWITAPEEMRQDVIQLVGITLLTRAQHIRRAIESRVGAGARNRRFVGYVASMARRRHLALLRKPCAVPLEEVRVAAPPHGEGLVDLMITARALQLAWDRAHDRRESVARGLSELRGLLFQQLSMDAVVQAEQEASGTACVDTVRERLYMRHRRARAALKKELRGLVAKGVVTVGHARAAEQWVDLLLVRRRAHRAS